MNELTIDIITAESSLLVGAAASSVTAPGVEGTFEVLPGHTTFLTELEVGPVTVAGPEGPQRFVVSGGFAEVMQGHIRILADEARAVTDLDPAALTQQLEELQAALEATDPFSKEAAQLRVRIRYLQTQEALAT